METIGYITYHLHHFTQSY